MSKRRGRARPATEELGHETVGFRRRREKRERAAAFLAGEPLLVGLDLAKVRHAVWFARRDLTPLRRFMVAHSREGVLKLLEQAARDRAKHGLDRTIVFMEATSYYWQNVANVLESQGVPYRTVAPLAVDRQREIEHLTYAKGDYRDAELITRLGGGGQWIERVLDQDPLWLELRTLALEHEAIFESEIADQLRVRSLLGLAVPEFLEVFADPLGNTARAALRRIGRPLAGGPRSVAELCDRVASTDGHRIIRGKIRALIARLGAEPSFGVERALGPTLARIGLAVERYDFLAQQRAELRSRLVDLYHQTPYRPVLDTVPGVTPENHALILGLVGDPKQYDRSSCLVKLAGTEPRENQSGNAEGSHSISRRGRAPLRCVLYRIVMGFARSNPEFTAYLSRMRGRDKNPLAWQQAAVAAGNKYLRLVHRMCVVGEVYNPARLSAQS